MWNVTPQTKPVKLYFVSKSNLKISLFGAVWWSRLYLLSGENFADRSRLGLEATGLLILPWPWREDTAPSGHSGLMRNSSILLGEILKKLLLNESAWGHCRFCFSRPLALFFCCPCFLCCLASVARLTYFVHYLEFYISERWTKLKAKICHRFPAPYEIWENGQSKFQHGYPIVGHPNS